MPKNDFGSARTINNLYFDLLGITPLSKGEEDQYTQFLSDRNLLVHHGGIYTIKYHGQRFRTEPVSRLVHWSSLVITPEDFRQWRSFLDTLVVKIADSSYEALTTLIKSDDIKLKKVHKEALSFLEWRDDELL